MADDYKAKRSAETARLAKVEKGTGEDPEVLNNYILGGVAGLAGTKGLGRLFGAKPSVKFPTAKPGEYKAADAAYEAKKARRVKELGK